MARRPSTHDLITSRKVPKALGPYVHAVRVETPGETLFISGLLPIEPTGRPSAGDIKRQAELVFSHLRNVIADAKFTMDDVVRCTVYLTDLTHLNGIDQSYQRMFVGQMLPARTVVQVAGLPQGAQIQVDAIAMKKGKAPEELLDEGAAM